MKNISIIVALDENNGIGKDNRLLCHIPGDLPRFKKITSGHTVIMGRNTFLSLPGGALKNRRNIVITDRRGDSFKGCEIAHSVEEALEMVALEDEIFIIGGASVYRQFLPLASRLYLTRIHKVFEADTFFPAINFHEWELISVEVPEIKEEAGFTFDHVILQRKNATIQ